MPPGPHALYVLGTRTSPGRSVRTAYRGTPRAASTVRFLTPQVTIRDRADIVCLVRHTYGNLFDYEVDDAGTSGLGHAEPACPNVDMGNPGSSYRR